MKLNSRAWSFAIAFSMTSLLVGCGGDDGDTGPQGPQGPQGNAGNNGANGAQSLVVQSEVMPGHMQCFKGGVQIDSGIDADADGMLAAGEITSTSYVCTPSALNNSKNFYRVATFPVCMQDDPTCDSDATTAAEIVAASADGMTLIYTDSPGERIGFVDLSNAAAPMADGVVDLTGEPTSVAVKAGYALVGVNTATDFINVSGHLAVIDIATKTITRTIDVGGQPDSVAVSPDGNYAAVVIENERDEDLGDGAPPQLPAGNFVIVDISGEVADWSTTMVDLTSQADLYPSDPEPEYVDINSDNMAVVTLQENNYIVLVDMTDGSIVNGFSAGSADLTLVDADEDAGSWISQTQSLDSVLREPDGVAWINANYFATADEGDLDGGSRGFTVFHVSGEVAWTAGNEIDHLTARMGHYPESRSGNKGNEPENAEMGVFGNERFLFVNSERSSLVLVYDVADPKNPMFKQALPAGVAPEGALAIPSRNLLVVASEEDSRDDKIRSSINVYAYGFTESQYPTLQSADRISGVPIPWAALSGLAADPWNSNRLYSVDDSYYQKNRIFTLDVSARPATIMGEMYVMDTNDVFAGVTAVAVADGTAEDDATRLEVFDSLDLAGMLNDDKTVNVDLEGVARAADGGFWLASEGAGTIGDAGRPVNSLNFVFKTTSTGVIEDVLTLPTAMNNAQVRFGFEGVSEYADKVYVAIQRAWTGDANPRIAIYDTVGDAWISVFYPLEAVASQNGGWVGLSDITSLGDGRFLVLERDNQGGPDAAIKRLYVVDLNGVTDGQTITKTLVRDLMGDLAMPGGLTPEKIEGSAITSDGTIYILNDNDGVEDNSGESQLIRLDNVSIP